MSNLIQLKTAAWNGNNRLMSALGIPGPTENNGADTASFGVTPTNPVYAPRAHVLVPATSQANQLVQLSAYVGENAPDFFQKAYFYGIKQVTNGADNMASAYTPNTGTVYVGEMDPFTGEVYCIDDVSAGGAQAMADLAVPGECYNFADFWVWIPTLGDGLVVKYQT